jgi:hypothetical protein
MFLEAKYNIDDTIYVLDTIKEGTSNRCPCERVLGDFFNKGSQDNRGEGKWKNQMR